MFATHSRFSLDREIVLAYACTHYESIRAADIQRLATENQSCYKTSNNFSVDIGTLSHGWTGEAHGYIKLKTPCDQEECRSSSLAEREERLITAVKTSRMTFQNTLHRYVAYGVRYHDFALAVWTEHADESHLALVHHTYGIETRDRGEDPVLQPFVNLHHILQRFEDEVKTGVFCEDFMETAIHGRDTFRTIAVETKPTMETLRDKVKRLATLESYADAQSFYTIVLGKR